MTRPQRWPRNAETARLYCLAVARESRDLCSAAKALIRQNRREEAVVAVAEIQRRLTEIANTLRLAKYGELSEELLEDERG